MKNVCKQQKNALRSSSQQQRVRQLLLLLLYTFSFMPQNCRRFPMQIWLCTLTQRQTHLFPMYKIIHHSLNDFLTMFQLKKAEFRIQRASYSWNSWLLYAKFKNFEVPVYCCTLVPKQETNNQTNPEQSVILSE